MLTIYVSTRPNHGLFQSPQFQAFLATSPIIFYHFRMRRIKEENFLFDFAVFGFVRFSFQIYEFFARRVHLLMLCDYTHELCRGNVTYFVCWRKRTLKHKQKVIRAFQREVLKNFLVTRPPASHGLRQACKQSPRSIFSLHMKRHKTSE